MSQSSHTRWTPRTTVCSIVEHDGLFLMVEERTPEGVRLNQPAGHLEADESLLAAVIRETREETGCTFTPRGVVGVYRWQVPPDGPTYLRFCFHGGCARHDPDLPLDEVIIRTHWLSYEEIAAQPERLRSPMVLRCLDDYRAGCSFPLDLLIEVG